jgi:ribonuclease E
LVPEGVSEVPARAQDDDEFLANDLDLPNPLDDEPPGMEPFAGRLRSAGWSAELAQPRDERPNREGREDERSAAVERDSASGGKKKRRRGKRGGRRRKGSTADRPGAESLEGAVSVEAIPGDDDDLGLLDERAPEPKGRGRRGRGHSRAESEDDDVPAPAVKRTDVILVNAQHTEEVRVAVVQDGRIVDLQMTVQRYSSYVNDIYRGRVVNLEPAIGAAFVDFGEGRNGFLHASDVLPAYGEPDWKLEKLLTTQIEADEWEGGEEAHEEVGEADEAPEGEPEAKAPRGGGRGGRSRRGGKVSPKRAPGGHGRTRRPRLPIEKLLQKGQMCVVQITKDAIGDKGPALTTYISIPGRYLVLMPSLARTGVSRKIEDDKERRRLKRILQSLSIPPGMGVIVRTAGVGKTKADIKRDLEYLLLAWDDFSRRLVSGRNPAPLYQESDVSVRTMRDLFSNATDKVVVDDEAVYRRMVEFTEKLMPENLDRVVLHSGQKPLFHAYGVEQDFERIFQRRVELPSGGSIVIDQTEALVAIDVNSGRTRDEGADFEDIALKTNLEAGPEIARQIRLRDMGGIIVVDFIDMLRTSNRRQVERAFRDALALDRARSKLGRISQFGLLELTRQRLGPGLSKLIYDPCPRCRGTGRRRSAASRAQAVLRRLSAALTMKGFSQVEVRTHQDTLDLLRGERADDVERLRQEGGREIALVESSEQSEDSVLRYLRTDGREVRPGGRRKR